MFLKIEDKLQYDTKLSIVKQVKHFDTGEKDLENRAHIGNIDITLRCIKILLTKIDKDIKTLIASSLS